MKNLSTILMALSILASLATLMACEETEKGNIGMIEKNQVSLEEWKLLAQRRIVFGHQSVGGNILSGVQELANQAGISLSVKNLAVETKDPGIIHFEIGENKDPYSKIKDFETKMELNVLENTDIAMMKLCYVDIDATTDAIKLAKDYSDCLDRLGKKFPKTIFIAITCPLTVVESGAKARIKKFLGRTLYGYVDNYKRKEFNDFLRNRYNESGHLFDLAQFENNGAGSYAYKEHPIEVLNPSITNDGGHLNAQGQQYIAAKLVKVLASVPLSMNK